MTKKGSRVGAISHADKDTVYLFGYGVYVGDEVPTPDTGGFGQFLHEAKATNPKIVLDDGKVVLGCECWWGPEEAIKQQIGERQVVIVDIDKARAKSKSEEDNPSA